MYSSRLSAGAERGGRWAKKSTRMHSLIVLEELNKKSEVRMKTAPMDAPFAQTSGAVFKSLIQR